MGLVPGEARPHAVQQLPRAGHVEEGFEPTGVARRDRQLGLGPGPRGPAVPERGVGRWDVG